MWKDRYKIGVNKIDEQHQELFTRLSNFIEVVMKEESYDSKIGEVGDTLGFLNEYCIKHFAAEEKYQRDIGFPGYEDHKKEHDGFEDEIAGYEAKFKAGDLNEKDIKTLSARLMTWLIMHVGYEDQKIGRYAKSKGLE